MNTRTLVLIDARVRRAPDLVVNRDDPGPAMAAALPSETGRLLDEVGMRVKDRELPEQRRTNVSAALMTGLIGSGLTWQPLCPHGVDMGRILVPPSAIRRFGMDHLGRDLASRLLAAGQSSLMLSAIVLDTDVCIRVLTGAVIVFGPFGLSRLTLVRQNRVGHPNTDDSPAAGDAFGAGLVSIAVALIVST
ncbi:MAG: hypothetical protein NXH97_22190 [Rhodobacteraceae bacterium]|nr:hypothetical protein [Paracoccaceae bacterium]